jgi:acetylglutamate kinase
VAYDIAFLAAVGINVVVVHGGGKAINRAMDGAGLKANFINGLRVTDEATIAIVKKTLDEIVNKDVCDTLSCRQGPAQGLAGDSVLVCQKLETDDDGNKCDLGYVGDVTEVKVKLIKKEIGDGFMPVISPVAEGYDGKPYNVNADTVAGRVASALRARRLVYMSDVPGLLADPPIRRPSFPPSRSGKWTDSRRRALSTRACARRCRAPCAPCRRACSACTSSTVACRTACCSRFSPIRAWAPRSCTADTIFDFRFSVLDCAGVSENRNSQNRKNDHPLHRPHQYRRALRRLCHEELRPRAAHAGARGGGAGLG